MVGRINFYFEGHRKQATLLTNFENKTNFKELEFFAAMYSTINPTPTDLYDFFLGFSFLQNENHNFFMFLQ